MCRVIAISSNKGGVGKTTTAVNLGIGLARNGKRVLLIDVDAQADLSKSLGIRNPSGLEYTLTEVLQSIADKEDIYPKAGIIRHDEGVDLMPGSINLVALDTTLSNYKNGDSVLWKYIEMLRDEYDYILIDSKPALVKLSVNVLAAADSVIIPVLAEYLPISNIEPTILSVRLVKRRLNHKLEVEGFVFTMFDKRTTLAKESVTAVKNAYADHVKIFDSIIPRANSLAKAPAFGESIYKFDPRGKGAEAYEALTLEVLANE